MFEYEVVPVDYSAEGQRENGTEWAALRSALNQCGRYGYRVVAVVDAPRGGGVIMEREIDETTAEPSVSQAAEDITWESSR